MATVPPGPGWAARSREGEGEGEGTFYFPIPAESSWCRHHTKSPIRTSLIGAITAQTSGRGILLRPILLPDANQWPRGADALGAAGLRRVKVEKLDGLGGRVR